MKIGLFGRGFVGDALYQDFVKKGVEVVSYDKYKEIGSAEEIIASKCDAIFLCLPTPYVEGHGFDLSYLEAVCRFLSEKEYPGLVVIKSTIEPGTCKLFSKKYSLNVCHNPEFLTARTANEDFKNQKHIVIGYDEGTDNANKGFDICLLGNFYKKLFPNAEISLCTSEEAEVMKLFVNNFYAIKIGLMNEYALLCDNLLINYSKVTRLMVKNGWMADMHLSVPGPDGKYGWGGACFPKDTGALNELMKKVGTPNQIINSARIENEKIREKKPKK